jgi:hypothetical protein
MHDHHSAKSSLPSITTRPTATEKARFRWLAERAGISESALALVAIREFLSSDGKTPTAALDPERLAAIDRITIRLRPGDRAALARRAADRGMKVSAYLAALARAHVQTNPPLPAAELWALKQSVEVLALLGRTLAQISWRTGLGDPEREALRKDLGQTRAALAHLKQATHDLARASLIAWESRSD